jgi:hypothetical protein
VPLRTTKDGMVNVNEEDSASLVIGTVSLVPEMAMGIAPDNADESEGGRGCFCIVAPTTPPTIMPITAKKTRAITALPLVVRQKGLVFGRCTSGALRRLGPPHLYTHTRAELLSTFREF